MEFEHIGSTINKNAITRDMEIELNKHFSRLLKEIYASTKETTCFCCKREVSSFCNSHTVPRFCLENIGSEGKVSGVNSILGLPSMGVPIGKQVIGINESGTFKLICKDCDSKIFSDYENPANYYEDKPPTQIMLSEIAMKNYLKFIYKRKIEIALYERAQHQFYNKRFESLMKERCKAGLLTDKLDLIHYKKSFQRAYKLSKKPNDTGFYIIYYRLLNYTTPVAVQAPIVLSVGFEDNIINDIFNMDSSFEPSDLHLCVFPMKEKTAIILFINNGDKTYKRFYKQFQKLSDTNKLGVINYMIFLYTEDFFLSKNLNEKINSDTLKTITSLTPIVINNEPVIDIKKLIENFTLSKWNCIPNLLSKEYSVNSSNK